MKSKLLDLKRRDNWISVNEGSMAGIRIKTPNTGCMLFSLLRQFIINDATD